MIGRHLIRGVVSRVLFLGVAALLFPACTHSSSEPASSPGKLAEKIVGGQPTTSTSVVGLSFSVPGGTAYCSGSIIDSSHVLTAAHCTVGVLTVNGQIPANILLPLGGSEVVPKDFKSIPATVVVDPDGTDLAVAATNIAGAIPVGTGPGTYTQQTFTTAGLAGVNGVGVQVTLEGYGLTDPNKTGTYGNLLSVKIPIALNGYYENAQDGSVTYHSIDIKTETAGMNSCNGDSGGAALVNLGGTMVQMGVIEAGDCAAESYAVDLTQSNYIAWISSQSSNIKTYQLPTDILFTLPNGSFYEGKASNQSYCLIPSQAQFNQMHLKVSYSGQLDANPFPNYVYDCYLPGGIFTYNGVPYASNGTGQYCEYDYVVPGTPAYPIIPDTMSGGQKCSGLPVIPNQFFNSNGITYVSNGQGQYCEFNVPLSAQAFEFIPPSMTSNGFCYSTVIPNELFNYNGITYASNGQGQYCEYNVPLPGAPIFQYIPSSMTGGTPCSLPIIGNEFFNYKGITYASNGQGQYCELNIPVASAQGFQFIPSSMTSNGFCFSTVIPNVFFNYHNLTYASNGQGQYCEYDIPVPSAQIYQYIPSSMTSNGPCSPLPSLPSGFFNFVGLTYYSNGQNHYCEYDLAQPGQSYQFLPPAMISDGLCGGLPYIPDIIFNVGSSSYASNGAGQYCTLTTFEPNPDAVYQFIPTNMQNLGSCGAVGEVSPGKTPQGPQGIASAS